MYTCNNCKNQISDTAAFCPYCGAVRPAAPPEMPKKTTPKSNVTNRQVRIVLIVAISAVTLTAVALLLLLLLGRSTKVRAFDFSCSQYTEEVNRLLGENKLDQNKWAVNEAHAVYRDTDFTIDLDLDSGSQLTKKITLSPADTEPAVKMAAVSLMVIDNSLSQKDALVMLPDYKDTASNTFIFEADEHKKAKKLTKETATALTEATDIQISTLPAVIATDPHVTDPPATEAPATEPPTTEAPNKSAYSAYLAHLESIQDDLLPLRNATGREDNLIALKDLNGDGTDEMIYAKYMQANHVSMNLTIVTYINGEVVTLYDELLVTFAGAGGKFQVFIGDDSQIYSIMSNPPNSNVTAFDVSGSGVSTTVLGQSSGHGTDNPDISYYIGDSQTDKEEYESYFEDMKNKAETYLCYYSYSELTINPGVNSIAMSYYSACDYLRNNS